MKPTNCRNQLRELAILSLFGLALSVPQANASVVTETTVHQDLDVDASPERVYEALTDEKQFAVFSRGAAQIEQHVGGAFKLFGGGVVGTVIELIPNSRIVLAWHPVAWPSGLNSVVSIELKANGSGTHLVLNQTGIPPGKAQVQADNWSKHVWEPLSTYLGAGGKQ